MGTNSPPWALTLAPAGPRTSGPTPSKDSQVLLGWGTPDSPTRLSHQPVQEDVALAKLTHTQTTPEPHAQARQPSISPALMGLPYLKSHHRDPSMRRSPLIKLHSDHRAVGAAALPCVTGWGGDLLLEVQEGPTRLPPPGLALSSLPLRTLPTPSHPLALRGRSASLCPIAVGQSFTEYRQRFNTEAHRVAPGSTPAS